MMRQLYTKCTCHIYSYVLKWESEDFLIHPSNTLQISSHKSVLFLQQWKYAEYVLQLSYVTTFIHSVLILFAEHFLAFFKPYILSESLKKKKIKQVQITVKIAHENRICKSKGILLMVAIYTVQQLRLPHSSLAEARQLFVVFCFFVVFFFPVISQNTYRT